MSITNEPITANVDPYRLPKGVVPLRYDVRLRPSFDDATFTGSVTIDLAVETPTDAIVLNAIELDIESVTLDGESVDHSLDASTERMTITPASTLEAGDASLTITFAGILNDKLRGFYRSTFVDADGNEQVIATTQMQATDCRRAFPCWDEPEFKAVFAVTLDVEDGLTAISNGAEAERSSADGRTVIRFADTMKMSSYLVAFVVGHLDATDTIDADGIPLRIVHVPGRSDLTAFGLDVGQFCLRWFQDYYGIDYPSDKVDLVALPDFAAGAMENLGCITFRETALLVDPTNSTQDERQRVADVVAHELAHMWFGDLVTMRWWNGIWLNEAFATFMEIAACDAFAPEWERWTSFGLERSAAFEVDSLLSTRPVEFEVESPAEADGMFDVLTYHKGGALLRMLEQYIGADVFQEGVSHYLRTHSHANTETNDLWDAIETTSGEPVRRMMDSWIWQPGFPLVSARLVPSAEGGRELELSQQRFCYSDLDPADDSVWVIPVHVRNGGDVNTVLLDSAEPVTVPLSSADDVVVVNALGHGFFRVAYDSELRARLANVAALADLSTLERYMLVDDAWSSTVAGTMSAADLLDVLDGFVDENEYGVWHAIVIALGGVSRLVDGAALDAFRARVRALVAPALNRLGDTAPGESDLRAKLRGQLLRTMGALGRDADAIARCRSLVDARRNGESVDPELLAAATSVVAANGDHADYDRMLDGFRNATTPQEELRHLMSLPEFNDADLIARTCELAMSGEVKSQNAPFLLSGAIGSRDHGRQAWDFVKEHWDAANDKFPNNTIVYMIGTVKRLTAPDDVTDTAAFFADHPIEQSAATLRQILERQRVNADLRRREADALSVALLD
ncbi:MAG: M1 family metallopeptidase [Ilumatobacter sp.]|uniref:M1 family metallopeptidase n=1 Tax=Ilumatobacter sp. TaxID=1967498 RepID=UPI003C78ACC3